DGLRQPARLLAQFRGFAQAAVEGDRDEQAELQKIEARIERLAREERRLIDAYQAAIITLTELAERRDALDKRRRDLGEQREQHLRLRHERARAQEVLADLIAFCERIRS